jgi:hypothetical protein
MKTSPTVLSLAGTGFARSLQPGIRADTERRNPMSDTTATYVFAPEDIVWRDTDLGRQFWISDELVGTDYSALFSAQSPSSARAAGQRFITTPTTTRSTS